MVLDFFQETVYPFQPFQKVTAGSGRSVEVRKTTAFLWASAASERTEQIL